MSVAVVFGIIWLKPLFSTPGGMLKRLIVSSEQHLPNGLINVKVQRRHLIAWPPTSLAFNLVHCEHPNIFLPLLKYFYSFLFLHGPYIPLHGPSSRIIYLFGRIAATTEERIIKDRRDLEVNDPRQDILD